MPQTTPITRFLRTSLREALRASQVIIMGIFLGCETVPLEERALYCDDEVSGASECKRLRNAYDRKLERERRGVRCPDGFILVKDFLGDSCVSQEQVRRWLGRMSPTM